MENQFLVPKTNATRDNRIGRSPHFWDEIWSGISSENYNLRKTNLSQQLETIISDDIADDRNAYIEVKFDDLASSKSKRPSQIWPNSDVQIVEIKDDTTATISGSKKDLEKLSKTINDASYEIADIESEVTKKIRNISREVYSVASFSSQTGNIEGRTDRGLREVLLGAQPDELIDCYIELYNNTKAIDYDEIHTQLSANIDRGVISKQDSSLFYNNMYYRAQITKAQIDTYLNSSDYAYIRVIRHVPKMHAQRAASSMSIASINVEAPETQQVFGVIDSGVSNQLIDPLCIHRESYLASGKTEDKNHGTFVCSLVLFGEDMAPGLRPPETLRPIGKFLDVQVMHKNTASGLMDVDPEDLLKAIKAVVRRYQTIKIFNISIASRERIDPNLPSKLTETLDSIARDEDVLFICVAGNQEIFFGTPVPYADIFEVYASDIEIAPPGDGVSVLTIGSISRKVDDDSITERQGLPAPFTRSGFVRGDVKKPDMVHSGGNHVKEDGTSPENQSDLSKTRYGLVGLTTAGFDYDFGTSLSAPLVTREAVKVYDFLKNSDIASKFDMSGNESNLMRAMLIHSASFQPLPSIRSRKVKDAYGYGIPDFNQLNHDGPDRISIMYADKLDLNEKLHRLQLTLPEFMETGSLEFIFSLSFNPPVNKNYKQYNMTSLTGSLRVPYQGLNEDGEMTTLYHTLSPRGDWRNYSNRNTGNINFKACIDSGLKTPNLEILIQLWTFDEYEKGIINRSSIFQPYSMILTIIDKDARGLLRQELMATNQFNLLNRTEIQLEV